MTRRSAVRGLAAVVAAAGLAAGTGACTSGGITAGKLQTSVSGTFANLYVLQQREQGHPEPTPQSLRARASCLKGTQADVQTGPGDNWVCQVTFLVAGPATPVTALYDVNVQTNGCYAADGDGPASVNGSRTIATGPGTSRLNPLRLLNGCFDIG